MDIKKKKYIYIHKQIYLIKFLDIYIVNSERYSLIYNRMDFDNFVN